MTTQNILLRIWVILHGRRENEFFIKLSFKLQPKKGCNSSGFWCICVRDMCVLFHFCFCANFMAFQSLTSVCWLNKMFSDWNASTSWICVPRGRPYILYHSITRTVIVWAAKNEFIQSVFKVKNHWKKRPFKRIKTVIDACAMVDIWFSFCFWCRVFWKVETCTSVLCDTALANVLSFSGRVFFHSIYRTYA